MDQAKEMERKKSIQQSLLDKETLAKKQGQHSEIAQQRQMIKIERIKNQIAQIDISLTKNQESIKNLQQSYDESITGLGKILAS